MKPFDLVKALAGESVVTRDGQAVTQLTHFAAPYSEHCLVGVVRGTMVTWDKQGCYFDERQESDYDLFMASKKRTVWANIYPTPSPYDQFFGTASIFDTEEAADESPNAADRLGNKAFPVEIEE